MIDSTEYAAYKKITASVYFLQLCSILLFGLPLLIAVGINFFYREDVKGTWLESHFDWQLKTAWVSAGGFSISGMTLGSPLSIFVVIISLAYLVFRVFEGWNALDANYDIGVN